MGNWKDPNVKKHVTGETPEISYSLFSEQASFINNYEEEENSELYKKDRFGYFENITVTYPSNRILDEKKLNIKLNANTKKLKSLENNKPLLTSYDEYSNTIFGNIVLHINDTWGILNYNNEELSEIYIPEQYQLSEILSDVNVEQNSTGTNISELTNNSKIQNAVSFVEKSISLNNYKYSNMISKKFRISIKEAENILSSNIFKKYTIKSIIKNMNINNLTYDQQYKKFDELFIKFLSNLNIYTKK